MKKTILLSCILFLAPVYSIAATINVPVDQPTIQNAINTAVDGSEIRVAEGNYCEHLSLEKSIEISLSGGWDSTHTTKHSSTSIQMMTIKSGTFTVEGLVIQNSHPDDSLASGLTAITRREILKAEKCFESAYLGYEDQTSNDADTARFFYALTKVASLWFDMISDGNPYNGLHTLGDIMDAFGCVNRDPWNFENFLESWPEILPSSSPTEAELQVFLYNVVRPELEYSINILDKVTQSFIFEWTEPRSGILIESDYGDVLFCKAVIKVVIAIINIQYSYNLDADINYQVNNQSTIQSFLEDKPHFITIEDALCLSIAKTYLQGALDDIDNAIDWILTETDDQSNDLISLTGATPDEIENAKCWVAKALASLNDSYFVTNDGSTIINISNFFTGINLRSLLPSFNEDNAVGLLPDTSFGGILLKFKATDPNDLNEDLDGDGTADIFEELGLCESNFAASP